MLLTGNHDRTLSESTTVSNDINLSKVTPTRTITPPRPRSRSLSIEDCSSNSSNSNDSSHNQDGNSSSSSDENSSGKATHTNVAVTTTSRCQMDGSIRQMRSTERGGSTNTNDDTTKNSTLCSTLGNSSSNSSSFGASNDLSFGTQTDVLVKRYHQRRQRAAAEAAVARTVSLPSSVSMDQKIQLLEEKEGPPSPLPQQLHPQAATMKRHRRDKTATSAMVGAGVGTLLLPVIGTVVGGFLSGYAANRSLKKYEKKVQRKWEREQFQRDANASQVAQNAVFV